MKWSIARSIEQIDWISRTCCLLKQTNKQTLKTDMHCYRHFDPIVRKAWRS